MVEETMSSTDCFQHWSATRKPQNLFTRPALGMFEVFGRTEPPILRGRHFQTALLTNLFLPRENNDIANVSLYGSQKGSNLCLKCARIRVAAGLRSDPLGELKHSPDSIPRSSEGPTCKGGREGRVEWKEKVREGIEKGEGTVEGKGREERKGEGCLRLNRAAGCLTPALPLQ